VEGPSVFLEEMFGEDLMNVTDFTQSHIENAESKPRLNAIMSRYCFSQLSYFLECPMRYKYAVVYNLRIPWQEAMGFGDNVHRVMEAIHDQAMQGRVPTDDEIPGIVAGKWINGNFIRPDEEKELMSVATKQIFSYLIDGPRAARFPNCCISPSKLASPHSSDILPFSMRKISIPVIAMGLLVGGNPMNSPLCIPRAVKRAATLSSSAIISSTVTLRSSKAARQAEITSFIPWIPGEQGSGTCNVKLGASSLLAELKSPLDGPSSKKRRTMFLFSSVDIDNHLPIVFESFKLRYSPIRIEAG